MEKKNWKEEKFNQTHLSEIANKGLWFHSTGKQVIIVGLTCPEMAELARGRKALSWPGAA